MKNHLFISAATGTVVIATLSFALVLSSAFSNKAWMLAAGLLGLYYSFAVYDALTKVGHKY